MRRVVGVPRLTCLVSHRDDLSVLTDLAEAGVDGFQVRAKELGGQSLTALAERVIAAVRPAGATVVVNDRLDVALAAGADGVHLGSSDLAVSSARRIAPELLIGATCRSRADIVAAERDGADYAGFGPVFATVSKIGLPEPLGPAALTPAAGVLPLVAIGGINARRARAVVAAGASGVAVIGGVWRQPDPVAAAKEIADRLGG